MGDPSGQSRQAAGRLFLVAGLVLVGGSLLSPGVVEVWAETRTSGWHRSVARMWSEPVSELSQTLHLGAGRRLVSELLEGDVEPVTTLPPATRPRQIVTSGTLSTTTLAPGATVVTTTTLAPLPTGVPTTTSASQMTLVLGSVPEEADSSPTAPVTSVPVSTAPVISVPVSTAPDTSVPVSTAPVTTLVSSTTVPTVTAAISTTIPSVTTTALPGLLAVRRATGTEPLRILGVGDSLMLDLQYGLERVLDPRPDVAVEGRGALGFGFVVPFWDWEEDVLPDYDHMVATIRPDVVVAMIGANEFQGYAIEGEDLEPGSHRWREVLATRADEAISHWLAGGALLYWWTTPVMADADYLTQDLNEVWVSAVASWEPWAMMLDSMEVLGDEDGGFRWHLTMSDGSLLALRKEHGVHFHEVGADMLARQLEERLVADGWLIPAG